MRRSLLNYVVDLVSLLFMLAMVATGLALRYILPPGTGGRGRGNALILWGGTRHEWGSIHFWISTGLLALLLVHLILHWSWACAITRRLVQGADGGATTSTSITRIVYGAATATVVVLGFSTFVWIASGSTIRTDHREPLAEQRDTGPLMTVSERQRGSASRPARLNSTERHESEADHQDIRGSMTLEEVARVSRISAALLRNRLGLPASAPLDERLGRLRRQYTFEMSEIRSAVHELKTNSSAGEVGAPDLAKKPGGSPQDTCALTRLSGSN